MVFISEEQKHASASVPLKRAAERSRTTEVPFINHKKPAFILIRFHQITDTWARVFQFVVSSWC